MLTRHNACGKINVLKIFLEDEMNINSVIDHCINLSYYDLENFAGENFMKVYRHIQAVSSTNPNDVLVPTIFTCIASDGKISEGEWKFIASFIGGYSYDEAFATAGEFYCDEAHRVVRDFIRAFPTDIAEAYISMCLAVLSVDKRISGDEVSFLNSIL